MSASAQSERLLLLFAVLVFAGTSVYAILRPRLLIQKPAYLYGAFATAIVFLFAAIAIRWVRENQGPFLTLYDVLLSNLFSVAMVYIGACLRLPSLRSSATIVLPFLTILGLWSLTAPAAAIPLPPTFDNYWLWLHVISGKIFFGLCVSATAVSILLLAREARKPKGTCAGATLDDRPVWQLMSMAFICDSFMLISGAVWAQSAWGRYWAWDPLETWALLTWLVLALVLHARVTFKRLPASWFLLGTLLVFTLAFLTFLGVPFVSIAPHKGVM